VEVVHAKFRKEEETNNKRRNEINALKMYTGHLMSGAYVRYAFAALMPSAFRASPALLANASSWKSRHSRYTSHVVRLALHYSAVCMRLHPVCVTHTKNVPTVNWLAMRTQAAEASTAGIIQASSGSNDASPFGLRDHGFALPSPSLPLLCTPHDTHSQHTATLTGATRPGLET